MSEEEFDCRTCSACCRQIPDGTALVSAEDIVRWKREARTDILDKLVPGHFGEEGLGTDDTGRCHFLGTPDNDHDCQVYMTRGWACHALEPGSPQCRSYRLSDPRRRAQP